MKLTTIVGGLIGAVVGSALGLVAARLVGGFADIVDRSYVPGFVVFSLILFQLVSSAVRSTAPEWWHGSQAEKIEHRREYEPHFAGSLRSVAASFN